MNKEKLEYYFVYGTLKRGWGNNRILQQSSTAQFIEEAVTEPKFNLYHLGGFPGVTENGETAVHGEIWSVQDVETKRRLDMLEGYRKEDPTGGLYNKKTIKINNKQVNIYLINRYNNEKNIIKSGKWEY